MNNTDFWLTYFQRHPEKMMGDADREIHELAVKALNYLKDPSMPKTAELNQSYLFNPSGTIDYLTRQWWLEAHPDFANEYKEWKAQQTVRIGVDAATL